MRRYRVLLRQNGIWSWSIVRLITRSPAAAAPIMFVMLSRTELGQYTVGAWMASTCVFTECIAAPILGARADRTPVAREARIALAVSAAALVALALGVTSLPRPVLIALAGLMGGSIAGLIGSLRVLLTRMLDDDSMHIGLTWDSVITNLTFAVAPLLVTTLALNVDGRAPLLLAAAGCVFSLAWLLRIPGATTTPAPARTRTSTDHSWRVLARAWPIYLTSAAAMFLSGAIEVSVSPLIEASGHDIAWAGTVLSGFSVAAVAGGLVYGLRRWPTGYQTQCLAFLILTCAFVAIGATVGRATGLIGILVPLAAAGFAQSCLVTARNLSLHDTLPERRLAAGNSVLYSAGCIGFGLSSACAGWFADHGQVIAFLLYSCAISAALAITGALAEKADRPRTPPTTDPTHHADSPCT